MNDELPSVAKPGQRGNRRSWAYKNPGPLDLGNHQLCILSICCRCGVISPSFVFLSFSCHCFVVSFLLVICLPFLCHGFYCSLSGLNLVCSLAAWAMKAPQRHLYRRQALSLRSGADGSIQAHRVGSNLRVVTHAAQHLKCSGPRLGPRNSTRQRMEVKHIRLYGSCQKQLKNLGGLHPSSTQEAKGSTRVPLPILKLQRPQGLRVRRLVCVAALELHSSLAQALQAFLNVDLCSSNLQHANPSARRRQANGRLALGMAASELSLGTLQILRACKTPEARNRVAGTLF